MLEESKIKRDYKLKWKEIVSTFALTFMTVSLPKKVSTNLHRKRLHFHVICGPYRVSKKKHTHTIDSSALQSVKNMWLQLNIYVIISCSHLERTCLLMVIFMVIQYLFSIWKNSIAPTTRKQPIITS